MSSADVAPPGRSFVRGAPASRDELDTGPTVIAMKKNSRSARSTAAGPRLVAADRRTRLRLRELCDEVIASFRVASDRDLLTDRDRMEAQALLSRMVPLPHGQR